MRPGFSGEAVRTAEQPLLEQGRGPALMAVAAHGHRISTRKVMKGAPWQIVVFSLFFGVACAAMGEKAKVLVEGIEELNNGTTPSTVHVTATKEGGETVEFDAKVRVDTPGEAEYYRHGGILQYVLRQMVKN